MLCCVTYVIYITLCTSHDISEERGNTSHVTHVALQNIDFKFHIGYELASWVKFLHLFASSTHPTSSICRLPLSFYYVALHRWVYMKLFESLVHLIQMLKSTLSTLSTKRLGV